MSCHICGRSSCTPAFHSLEEQESFNDVAEKLTQLLEEACRYIYTHKNSLAASAEMCIDEEESAYWNELEAFLRKAAKILSTDK